MKNTGFDDDKSDVDVSSITPDHKDTGVLSVDAQDKALAQKKIAQPKKASNELPEADVDISSIENNEDKKKEKLDPDDGFDEGFFPEAKNPVPKVTKSAVVQ